MDHKKAWQVYQCGDRVRLKQSGLSGVVHHWTDGGASVRLNEPIRMQHDCFIHLVSHVVMLDAELDEWEKC